MTVRTEYLNHIEPALEAAGVRLVRGSRASVGEIQKLTAIARTVNYERTPQAPLRNITWNGLLTIVSPKRGPEGAEDELEDILETLAPSLLSAQYIFQSATLADWDDQHFCLDIAVMSIFQKE